MGLTVAGLLGVLVALAAVFYAGGGRWFDVVSPSMGQSAPVGSLVLTRPITDLSQLYVGRTISYREQGVPNASSRTALSQCLPVRGQLRAR